MSINLSKTSTANLNLAEAPGAARPSRASTRPRWAPCRSPSPRGRLSAADFPQGMVISMVYIVYNHGKYGQYMVNVWLIDG